MSIFSFVLIGCQGNFGLDTIKFQLKSALTIIYIEKMWD